MGNLSFPMTFCHFNNTITESFVSLASFAISRITSPTRFASPSAMRPTPCAARPAPCAPLPAPTAPHPASSTHGPLPALCSLHPRTATSSLRPAPCDPHCLAQHRTVLSHAVPCSTVPRRAVPCRAVPYRAVPCYAKPPLFAFRAFLKLPLFPPGPDTNLSAYNRSSCLQRTCIICIQQSPPIVLFLTDFRLYSMIFLD